MGEGKDIVDRLYAVIMAGGPGKRFWPLSTARRPKPFLRLFGMQTLIQACWSRLREILPPDRIFVVAARDHEPLVAEQLPELPPENRVGEAQGRDSAACVALGAALVAHRDPEAIAAVLPADQVITPTGKFVGALKALAEATAAEACIGTLGIAPTEPAVRFGYIEVGERIGEFGGLTVHRVARFKEKPGPQEAQQYVSSGNYLWNAGIFVAPAAVMKEEIRTRFEPLGKALGEFERLLDAGVFPSDITERVYGDVPKISIDYAVIEKLEKVITLKAPFSWDDVGDWRALKRHMPGDSAGNVSVGRHVDAGSRNTIVFAEKKLIATLGLENVVVVEAEDGILVADQNSLDDLKGLVEAVERKKREARG